MVPDPPFRAPKITFILVSISKIKIPYGAHPKQTTPAVALLMQVYTDTESIYISGEFVHNEIVNKGTRLWRDDGARKFKVLSNIKTW